MKTFIIILSFLCISQNVKAQEFYISYEARGAFLGDNKFPVAESPRKPALNETSPWNIKYLGKQGGSPIYLKFDSSYSHKAGLGFKFKQGFDIGFFHSQLWNSSQTNDPDSFAGSILLDTSDSWYDFLPFNADKDKVWATNKYKLWNVDLEIGYNFSLPRPDNLPNATFRIMTGIRYAEYNQNFIEKRTSATFGVYSNGERRLEAERIVNLKIKGIGPRLGLMFNLPTGLFNLFGAVNYSILFSKRNINDDSGHVILGWLPGHTDLHALVKKGLNPEENGGKVIWVQEGGYQEKDKNIIIRNLEIEGGVEYIWTLNNKSSIVFNLGYRYDKHFNAMTTCGGAKVKNPDDRTFGKCKTHIHSGKVSHSAHHLAEDFISHGPFLRTTFKF